MVANRRLCLTACGELRRLKSNIVLYCIPAGQNPHCANTVIINNSYLYCTAYCRPLYHYVDLIVNPWKGLAQTRFCSSAFSLLLVRKLLCPKYSLTLRWYLRPPIAYVWHCYKPVCKVFVFPNTLRDRTRQMGVKIRWPTLTGVEE